jgi:hypothetical protein
VLSEVIVTFYLLLTMWFAAGAAQEDTGAPSASDPPPVTLPPDPVNPVEAVERAAILPPLDGNALTE